MAPLFGRLFASEQTRGLSGDTASGVALDDANPYYNYRLRRHKAEGDLIAEPGLLWYTSPYVKRRTGLGTHVAAEKADGVATFTDVLLILSEEDWARLDDPSTDGWMDQVQQVLAGEFEQFCRREGFVRPHPERPLLFRFLVDGSPEVGGQRLGLSRGEFVTGLLPNLYTGPVQRSYPVIAVHMNIPGAWEGYQEVGRLYNDQLLFTLGDHWLDNFRHPGLQKAALYRLQQAPDGGFVHIINPDMQDKYQVSSSEQDGASVLTLATRAGQPVAYLVLALVDSPAAPVADAPLAEAPTVRSPSGPPSVVPDFAPPMLLDDSLLQPREPSRRTILPSAPSERIFTLAERGALLQKVHFSAFMEGYDVYLGAQGELGTVVDERAAVFEVRKREISLRAEVPGVRVGDEAVRVGASVPLVGHCFIEYGTQRYAFRDLRDIAVDGWPYVAEIRRPASSSYLSFGDAYLVGRSRECRVTLPDESRNDNIVWKASVGEGATIRAKSGEVRKSQFYTDSIMVASEHARIDLSGNEPVLVCAARQCYVYIRRDDEVLPLYPAASEDEPKERVLFPGDEVLVGNIAFQVGFNPVFEEAIAAPAGPAFSASPASWSDPPLSAPSTSAIPAVVEALDEDDDGLPSSLRDWDDPTRPYLPRKTGTPVSTAVVPPPFPDITAGDDDDIVPPPRRPDLSLTDAPPLPPPASLAAIDTFPPLDGGAAPASGPTALGALPVLAPSRARAGRGPSAPPRQALPPIELPEPTGGSDGASPPPPPEEALAVLEEPFETPSAAPSAPPPAAPATVPPPPPSVGPAAGAFGPVVATDDADAQFELGRPMHLIQAGWTVNGEVRCGNHQGAQLVIPENRVTTGQSFVARDYFRLAIRGRRGSLEVLAPSEMLIDEVDVAAVTLDDPEAHVIDIIRRDDRGDEDFAVRLQIREDKRLPDPRARFVAIDWRDPLAAALVIRGLGRGAPRALTLGGITATFTFADGAVTVSDYLASYRRPDGSYAPFFVQQGEGRYRTAPEDGSSFVVRSGDQLVCGSSVFVLREE